MSTDEQALLDEVNADNWALLYRCRWSHSDADRVVPRLTALLDSTNPQIMQESLRALHRIGTPAALAAPRVAEMTESNDSMTKRLAVLTLGQIAHSIPDVCVGPLAAVLNDAECCRDALRALAYIGSDARNALDQVQTLFSHSDAKVRKAAITTACSINAADPKIIALVQRALSDRSKIVREAASKCLRATTIG